MKYSLSFIPVIKTFITGLRTEFITVLRFSPSAIPQMSDIHIRIHLTGLKEEEKNFFDDNQG